MTYDTHFDDLALNQPEWMGQWIEAELDSVTFNVADVVLAQADKPDSLVTAPVMVRHVLNSYYTAVSDQCPDLWPAILLQLKRQNTVVPLFSRIAASVLALVAIGSLWFMPGFRSQPPTTVATLPALPYVAPVAENVPLLTGPKTVSSQVLKARNKVNAEVRRIRPRYKTIKRAISVEKSTLASLPVNRSQRLKQAILDVAQQSVKKDNAPGSLDYVFNVSAPAKDELVLGLSAR